MPDAPAPLTPPDCDLRDFAFMPLDVVRVRDSEAAVVMQAEEFRAAVLLWCAAWHQVPAASLPDDDRMLANLAGFGRDVASWRTVKDGALRHFVKCSDGRLYHPVIAEKAVESWGKKHSQRNKTAAALAAHWGQPSTAAKSKATRSQRLAAARQIAVHTATEWQGLLEVCEFRCVVCGSDQSLCKDHIVPVYQGGSDGIENLQPMCTSCNCRKGADSTDHRPPGWRDALNALLQGIPNASSQGEKRLQGKGEGQGIEQRKDKKDSSALAVATAAALAGKLFEDFWAAYPKRDRANPKSPARDLFIAAIKSGENPDIIIAAVKRYAAEKQRTGEINTQFVAQAQTWLPEKRWVDYTPRPADEEKRAVLDAYMASRGFTWLGDRWQQCAA